MPEKNPEVYQDQPVETPQVEGEEYTPTPQMQRLNEMARETYRPFEASPEADRLHRVLGAVGELALGNIAKRKEALFKTLVENYQTDMGIQDTQERLKMAKQKSVLEAEATKQQIAGLKHDLTVAIRNEELKNEALRLGKTYGQDVYAEQLGVPVFQEKNYEIARDKASAENLYYKQAANVARLEGIRLQNELNKAKSSVEIPEAAYQVELQKQLGMPEDQYNRKIDNDFRAYNKVLDEFTSSYKNLAEMAVKYQDFSGTGLGARGKLVSGVWDLHKTLAVIPPRSSAMPHNLLTVTDPWETQALPQFRIAYSSTEIPGGTAADYVNTILPNLARTLIAAGDNPMDGMFIQKLGQAARKLVSQTPNLNPFYQTMGSDETKMSATMKYLLDELAPVYENMKAQQGAQ